MSTAECYEIPNDFCCLNPENTYVYPHFFQLSAHQGVSMVHVPALESVRAQPAGLVSVVRQVRYILF